ncbi:PQQ-binding-like beta-propeller repeat protein [Micromonospora sp. C72]|uniref:outer membrane protein assembly factor BamB family protein n=1 Tax=Micromonospora sp. C72 TaxID=2824880 RepID=UPI001B391F5C|nr:PQQ-binding-like beta-propeller repeat protein [Micromonospora sp. C72]MBQ1046252.1 PQQ-binding-like beta-propeller repeat protein [Micromonospora sp. C72]
MSHPRRYAAAGLVVLVGAGLILTTIGWRWGHLAYGIGVAAVVGGVVWVVTLMARSTVTRLALSAGAAVVLVAGAVVPVTGLPQSPPQWKIPAAAQRPNGESARTGDLIIIGGTARHARTGAVAWAHEGPDAKPLLVEDSLVVIGTEDGSIGVDPPTGREIWRSTVTGRGIAHDRKVLVVAARDGTGATALDLTTGATLWRQSGRPVMECDLGPVDRFSPAREQSHVLLVRDEGRKGNAELIDLAGGRTTIADVDCSVAARLVGEVLLQADGKKLAGRSPADGRPLWSTPVEQPWHVDGSGSTVFTPTDRAEVVGIDVTTGRSRRIAPPPGTRTVRLVSGEQRTPDVWALLDVDSGAALWNPGTGRTVKVPDAVAIRVGNVDVSSGWIGLSGTTRDFTGATTRTCWAFSPDGRLSAPFPGAVCLVEDGLLETSGDVYPIR